MSEGFERDVRVVDGLPNEVDALIERGEIPLRENELKEIGYSLPDRSETLINGSKEFTLIFKNVDIVFVVVNLILNDNKKGSNDRYSE